MKDTDNDQDDIPETKGFEEKTLNRFNDVLPSCNVVIELALNEIYI